MWKFPWKFKEGFMICAGLLLTGFFLNLLTGPVPSTLMRFPANIWMGIIYLLLFVTLVFITNRSRYLRWFTSHYASISSITAFLVLVIILGLTKQEDNPDGIWLFGFSNMLKSWPFALLLLYLISVLGLVTIHRLKTFTLKKDIPFVLNHAGLFIALFAALLGSDDIQRLQMAITYNTPEWRAVNSQQKLVELPLAVELDSFIIEEYPPKLMLIDRETGEPVGNRNANVALIEKIPGLFNMENYTIEVLEWLPYSAPISNSDTSRFVAFHTKGAVHALNINVKDQAGNVLKNGWLSCGSHVFQPRYLFLDSASVLVMPNPEIKRFTSKVSIYTKEGETLKSTIEVNKPHRLGKWKMYQLSYDQEKGRWSEISVIELISDPWLPFVYSGFFMMIAGALTLVFVKIKPKENELE